MFKPINRGRQAAISLDKKNKSVTGFLIGFEHPKKGKYKKSVILNFVDADGNTVNVWGTAQVNGNLLTRDGKHLEPAYVGKLVRLTFNREVKLPGRKMPMKDITVEVDTDKALPGSEKRGKAYQLDASKKMS